MTIAFRNAAPEQRRLDDLANPTRLRAGNNAAALVVHGFTATPHGMASLVAPLAAAGWDVHVPALPGHGGHPDDLAVVRWQDWRADVQARYRELRAGYARVAVVGQSLGAALCRLLLDEATPPDAAVLLAMPWRINTGSGRMLAPVFDALPPLTRRLVWIKDGGSDISDPALRHPEDMYVWTPLQSICELHKLFRFQARTCRATNVPTLAIHSRNDHTAEYVGALRLARRLGTAATLLTVERSFHVLTQDVERDALAATVAAFVSGRANALPVQSSWRLSDSVSAPMGASR